MNLYLGLDFGTSGARAVAINTRGQICTETQHPFEDATNAALTERWQTALFTLFEQIPSSLRQQIKAIAINGTSSTVLLCNFQGIPVSKPLLYNDTSGSAVLDLVSAIAPPHHTVLNATSSLAKLLWLVKTFVSASSDANSELSLKDELALAKETLYFLHQADWLAFLLHGKLGISDYHNALKLGYDVANFCYPTWLTEALIRFYPSVEIQLPKVLAPGTLIGEIKIEISAQFGFPKDCLVAAGTTDSIAAFIASGAQRPGEAVTSLGSTLVLKLLSHTRIDDAKFGIYSHRFGDLWLVGGASNTGGAVLRHFFNEVELEQLSQQIDPKTDSFLDYYPLLKPGERFPINDPNLPPRLTPRPVQAKDFLQGLLASIARIEAQGYRLLQDLGATPLTHVYTAGGGAKNPVWTAMRQRYLQVPVERSNYTEAAYGTALLAKQSYES